jgi:hypothetical protein
LVATILAGIGVELPIKPQRALPRNLDRILSGSKRTRFPGTEYDSLKMPADVAKERLVQTQESLQLVPSAARFNRSYRNIMRILLGTANGA